jgi:hypothetical protein
MGLFDDINVKWKLPELLELKGTLLTQDAVQNGAYQTKDLDCFMYDYTIHEDGTVTKAEYEKTQWIKDKDAFMGGYIEGENLQHTPLTGNRTFNFYNYINMDEGGLDFYIEWQATVLNGKIHSIVLREFNSESNQGRLDNIATWQKMEAARKQYYSSLEYKYFYKYTDAIINCFVKGVLGISRFIGKICDKINRAMYKLRR